MKKLQLEELGRITLSEFKNAPKIPVCILLDNVRSLHNVGSAFRTADAFRVEKVILTGITGTPPHREIQKTALGATESVVWQYVESPAEAIKKLKQEKYQIILVEQTSKSVALDTFLFSDNQKYCFVFGNEVNGVSDEIISLGDGALEIPQIGTKHSLNIAVCVGIVVWESFKQLEKKSPQK